MTRLALMTPALSALLLIEQSCVPPKDCVQSDAAAMAAAENGKAQVAFTQRLMTLQMKTADECVKAGFVPVLNAGNVDCKAKPK